MKIVLKVLKPISQAVHADIKFHKVSSTSQSVFLLGQFKFVVKTKKVETADVMKKSGKERFRKKKKRRMSYENENSKFVKACRTGNIDEVKILLSSVPINFLESSEGYVLLCKLLKKGMIEVAKLLVQNGVKVNSGKNDDNMDTPLHYALSSLFYLGCRDVEIYEMVQLLLSKGAAVNARNQDKNTPLHLAIEESKEEIIDLLLKYGANLEFVNKHGHKPLHLAILCLDENIVKFLITNGATIHHNFDTDSKCLHRAINYNSEETLKYIFDHNDTFEGIDSEGFTPLHKAIHEDRESIIKLLLEKENTMSCIIHQKNNEGFSLLHTAVMKSNVHVTAWLLSYGCDINSTTNFGTSILHTAIERGNENILDILLRHNIELNKADNNGFTTLHMAVKNRNLYVTTLILTSGVSPNVRSNSGVTPLHIAAYKGFKEICNLLLDYNADNNAVDSQNSSILHEAVLGGYEYIVKLVLKSGCFVNGETRKTKMTPLHIAVNKQHEVVVEYLLNYGADVNAKNSDDETPLLLAVKEYDPDIVHCLLTHQPDIEESSNKLALCLAVLNGEETVIAKQLINYGFTLRSEDVNDVELLKASVEHSYVEVLQDILKHGTEVVRDIKILNQAIRMGNLEIVKMLLDYGFPASPNPDENEEIPLFVAYECDYLNTCRLLVSKGANIDSIIHEGCTLLEIAIRNSNEEFCKFALKHGANVNQRSIFLNATPLQYAYESEFKYLLNYNADVHVRDDRNFTPLHRALRDNMSEETVNLLLQKGSDVNAITNTGSTPLHIAATSCNENIIKLLLEKGADSNARDENDYIPLYYSILSNNKFAVPILLDQNLDKEDKKNKMALCLAIKNSINEILQIFFDRGITILVEDFSALEIPEPIYSQLENECHDEALNGIVNRLFSTEVTVQSILHYQVLRSCVEKGIMNIFKNMLTPNVDVNTSLELEKSLLILASQNGHPLIVEELLKLGANVNYVDSSKRSALHSAALEGFPEVVAVLLKWNADIDARTEDNETPLYLAVVAISFTSMLLLLKAGANVNIPDSNKNTPLHMNYDCEDIFELLLFYDAEINAENISEETPLQTALKVVSPEIVTILLDYGATYNYQNRRFIPENSVTLMKHKVKTQVAQIYNFEYPVDSRVDDFRIECEEEVRKMKMIKLGYKFSVYDVLTKKEKDLVPYFRNDSIIENLVSIKYYTVFPIYASILKVRIKKGKMQKLLMDLSLHCLLTIFDIQLPDFIGFYILSHLNNKELRYFIQHSPIEEEDKNLVQYQKYSPASEHF